jgi:5-methylcytosine-specific restriction protein A
VTQRAREDRERRGTVTEQGYGSRWRKAKTTYLSRPENRACRIRGPRCTTLATMVDHRVAWQSGRTDDERQRLFWDVHGNWRPACRVCHSEKTLAEDQRRNADGTFGGRSRVP